MVRWLAMSVVYIFFGKFSPTNLPANWANPSATDWTSCLYPLILYVHLQKVSNKYLFIVKPAFSSPSQFVPNLKLILLWISREQWPSGWCDVGSYVYQCNPKSAYWYTFNMDLTTCAFVNPCFNMCFNFVVTNELLLHSEFIIIYH